MQEVWRVTYKQGMKYFSCTDICKLEIIYKYLQIYRQISTDDISELKIWKGETDYTPTLNKFLMK